MNPLILAANELQARIERTLKLEKTLEEKVREEDAENERLRGMVQEINSSLVMYSQQMREMSQGIEKELNYNDE